MKKTALIILATILVLSMMLTLVGCSTATVQGQLRNIWRPYEKYVYDVTDGETNGTYTVEITKNSATSIALGDMTLENLKEGYIINTTLSFGEDLWESGCYMQTVDGTTFLVPIASYYKRVGGEYTDKLSAKYEGKNYKYTITEYGAPRDGEISLKAPFYDNVQIQQVLRAVKTLGAGFTFTFNTPIADENTVASLTASCSVTETITWGDEQSAKCNKVVLARSTQVVGASQTLYYSVDPIKVDGWSLVNVLISFREPISNTESMLYTLKSISLTKATDEGQN